MRRAFAFYLALALFLGSLGGVAWLTRNPDAEILRRAQDWPWVGPLAARFRQAYLPRDGRFVAAVSETDVEIEETWLRDRADRRAPSPQPPPVYRKQVWILAGLELKANPGPDAATVHTFDQLARAGKIENRGDWYHVDHRGRVGWVLLEGYDEEAETPYGEAPEPPRPVAARPPDEERLASVRRYLRGRERVLTLGPYALYTDCKDDDLLSHLGAVAGQLEALYVERYARAPVGAAAETVVLFQSDIAYRLVQHGTERLAGLRSAGHNSEGIAVLYVGGRSRDDVIATMIHELAHFLNRRAVGPQLPPWLDEGLADDLAAMRVDAGGRIHPGQLGGELRQTAGGRDAGRWHAGGAVAALLRLRDAARAGELPSLPDLIATEWEDFVRPPEAQLHYAAAAFWVRYLLEGDEGRHSAGFRAFLAAVANGAPPDAANLQASLVEPWDALGIGFRAWIDQRAAAVGLPYSGS